MADGDLVVAVLVHPDFPQKARPQAYVTKLAEKHPTAIIASAGVGWLVYETERAALRAGLRVAAFRAEPDEPTVAQPRRPPQDDDDLPADPVTRETRYSVMVSELLPTEPAHLDDLWTHDRRSVWRTVGHRAAELAALMCASKHGSQVVVFTHRDGWPGLELPDAQVLGP